MSSASPTQRTGDAKHLKSGDQSQLSDLIVSATATSALSSPSVSLLSKNGAADDLRLSVALTTNNNSSSPTKSTPTKSKSKKKNDARKRNARKQAATSTSPTPLLTSNTEQRQPSETHLEQSSSQSSQNSTPQKLAVVQEHHQSPQSQQQPTNPKMETISNDSSPQAPTTTITNQQQAPISQGQQSSPQQLSNPEPGTTSGSQVTNNKSSSHDTNSWRRRQRENRELREHIKLKDSQLIELADKMRQQMLKIKELESSLVATTRTCNQFEKLLQQELSHRTRLESENEKLINSVARLKSQINAHEKNKSTNDELIRVLNATLMERETEVSILKLKMTRIQTNPSAALPMSFTPLSRPDPCKTYTNAGRSNSEFSRNSYTRSTMMADMSSARSSASQLVQHATNARDASFWANVPEELTPSKRPLMLERSFQPIYNDHIRGSADGYHSQTSTPITRDRRYRTLPRSLKSPNQDVAHNEPELLTSGNINKNEPKSIEVAPLEPQSYISGRQSNNFLVTNLDDSNNTSQSSGNRTTTDEKSTKTLEAKSKMTPGDGCKDSNDVIAGTTAVIQDHNDHPRGDSPLNTQEPSHYSTIGNSNAPDDITQSKENQSSVEVSECGPPPSLPTRSPSTPVKISKGLKRIFGKFRRADSSTESLNRTGSDFEQQTTSPIATTLDTAASTGRSVGGFQRGTVRSTIVSSTGQSRSQMSPMRRAMDFQTDKPFAEWDTDMLVDWLTTIGLSMYAIQCRRWVKCGAHIMNATPAEVDKGLGISNHLHRKKLRLAISELNGDCDKITKAAAKLDYLWVARWLDDIGLPQYKEAFINARVDGRVLNYLTVEDLVSLGVKSVLHHSSIRCGIRVLRSINFDWQLLKRRATAEEIDQMNSIRQNMDHDQADSVLGGTKDSKNESAETDETIETSVALWTCHRVMEWLRMIDFAEFASNLRGSGVHGGLIMFEDGFNIDTMCSLLSIPASRTLLRRHLATFFEHLIGKQLVQRKSAHKELSSNQQLNPLAEIKISKKSGLWFGKLKSSSKVGQDGMDEYLCPMYPVEPQLIKSPVRKTEVGHREGSSLARIPESINV